MDYEKITKKYRKKELFDSFAPTIQTVNYKLEDIKKILMHRPPFLLIDSISKIDLENKAIVGHKKIDPDDPVFAGHFPGYPVYPGVLQVEMVGQLAIIFYSFLDNNSIQISEKPNINVRVVRINNSLFQHEVLPGDNITINAKVLENDSYKMTGIGQVEKDGKICSVTIGEFYIMDPSE